MRELLDIIKTNPGLVFLLLWRHAPLDAGSAVVFDQGVRYAASGVRLSSMTSAHTFEAMRTAALLLSGMGGGVSEFHMSPALGNEPLFASFRTVLNLPGIIVSEGLVKAYSRFKHYFRLRLPEFANAMHSDLTAVMVQARPGTVHGAIAHFPLISLYIEHSLGSVEDQIISVFPMDCVVLSYDPHNQMNASIVGLVFAEKNGNRFVVLG